MVLCGVVVFLWVVVFLVVVFLVVVFLVEVVLCEVVLVVAALLGITSSSSLLRFRIASRFEPAVLAAQPEAYCVVVVLTVEVKVGAVEVVVMVVVTAEPV